MADFADIRVEIDGPVGSLIIARPDQRNTVSPHTLAEICRAMDVLTGDGAVRAILFRAEGEHFSAGADFKFLDKMTQMSPAAIREQVYTHFQGAARRIYNCPKPVVAAVQGAAITVGCELALACDFRVVADDAFFQESWVKLGIMPPLGGLFLLPRLIGMGRASQMVLRGTAVKAEEAERIGLASEIVPRADLDARGMALARELADAAPEAYRSIKLALRRGLESSMEAEFSANVMNQALLLSSADFREGLDAVRARRKPEFKGQ